MSATNGNTNSHGITPVASDSRFDPNFTQHVIDATGPKATPRMRQVMSSLIKHVHDFARETELTVDEWMAGVEMINWAGKMSDDKRNEGQLLCDVIGLESYVTPPSPASALHLILVSRIRANLELTGSSTKSPSNWQLKPQMLQPPAPFSAPSSGTTPRSSRTSLLSCKMFLKMARSSTCTVSLRI